MKRQSTSNMITFFPPRLSDAAAEQLIELLGVIMKNLEHHYGPQIHQHRKRRANRAFDRLPRPPADGEPPF